MDPAHAAQAAQAHPYGVDAWINVTLPVLTKVWQGIGGARSDFFLSEEDTRQARGAYVGLDPYSCAQTLWQFAQVRPHLEHGYRQGIREFVVDLDAPAAVSVCVASLPFGRGGVVQYFVPNWDRYLHPTGREYQFGSKSYPRV